MARPRSLEFSSNLGFLSTLDVWTLVPVNKHCLERHTVDTESDDRVVGWKQN